MTVLNKQSQVTSATQLDAGLQKNFTNSKQPLMFGGSSYTPASVGKLLQSYIALLNDVDAAKAAYQAKVKVMRTQAPTLRTQIRAFVVFVRATFGNQPDVLADFGLAPYKAPGAKTVVVKAAAVQKNLATRQARGTKGPKQKKAITGASSATAPTVAATTPSGSSPAVTSPQTGNATTGNVPTGNAPAVASPVVSAPAAGASAGPSSPTHA
jgi:hypothetical protein